MKAGAYRRMVPTCTIFPLRSLRGNYGVVLRQRDAHRLLDQDVHPGLQRRDGYLRVINIGIGDEHRIDRIER